MSLCQKEFSDTYDQSKYNKSQAYTKSNTNFSFLTTSFSVLLSLYFILSGFYNDIDLFIRNDLQISNDIVRGLCFFLNTIHYNRYLKYSFFCI